MIKLRQATPNDAGRIAYLILVWDQELPEHLRMVRHDADAALGAAIMMTGPKFVTWLAEADGEVVGVVAINRGVSLFGFHEYGQVAGVFVLPKYRGGRLLGLRLLRKAMELKQQFKWAWLEVQPWADAVNMQNVLIRLGFDQTVHSFSLR